MGFGLLGSQVSLLKSLLSVSVKGAGRVLMPEIEGMRGKRGRNRGMKKR